MNLSMKIRLIWAAVGISAGFMAGPIFLARYQNYAVFCLGLFSSICAIYLFYIHWAYYKTWMHDWSRIKVKLIVYINAIICITAFATMIVFLTWATIVAEPLVSQGNNKWMIAVWSWMTSKWTMASSIYTYRYSRKVMMPILDTDGDIPQKYDSIYFRSANFLGANAPLAPAVSTTGTQTDSELF